MFISTRLQLLTLLPTLISAQFLFNSTTSTVICPAANGAFCASEILLTCMDSVPSLQNCNTLLGANGWCSQTTGAAGDGKCILRPSGSAGGPPPGGFGGSGPAVPAGAMKAENGTNFHNGTRSGVGRPSGFVRSVVSSSRRVASTGFPTHLGNNTRPTHTHSHSAGEPSPTNTVDKGTPMTIVPPPMISLMSATGGVRPTAVTLSVTYRPSATGFTNGFSTALPSNSASGTSIKKGLMAGLVMIVGALLI
jgi:hypothetical protein